MMTTHLIPFAVAGAALAFVVYRRFRRTFGRQRIREKGMSIRILVLGLIGVLALLPPYVTEANLMAAAIGGLAGVALGLLGFARTAFEVTPQGKYYTPYLYIGLGVSALFIGRLAYRLVAVWPEMQAVAHQAGTAPHARAAQMAAYQHNPLTVGLYFLLAGYYICYYIAIIRKSRRLAVPADDEPADSR